MASVAAGAASSACGLAAQPLNVPPVSLSVVIGVAPALAEDEAPGVEARAVERPLASCSTVISTRPLRASISVPFGIAVRSTSGTNFFVPGSRIADLAAQRLGDALLAEHRLRDRRGAAATAIVARRGGAPRRRVGHAHADRVGPGRGVAAEGERVVAAGELVRAVAVEVERVGERLALGVGRAAGVERDRRAGHDLGGRGERRDRRGVGQVAGDVRRAAVGQRRPRPAARRRRRAGQAARACRWRARRTRAGRARRRARRAASSPPSRSCSGADGRARDERARAVERDALQVRPGEPSAW